MTPPPNYRVLRITAAGTMMLSEIDISQDEKITVFSIYRINYV